MSPDKLAYMANQIARFFDSQRDGDPAERTARHLQDFWDPRMRAQLAGIVAAGGAGLSATARAGAEKLRETA
jgi:formate dehydrogenase subunit delta